MKREISCAVAGGLLASLLLASASGLAATRGGKMIYARYADSLFLDPVLNDANVDIWILTNLYDTLLLPTADGQGVSAGLATKWEVSADGKNSDPHAAPGHQILRRLADHRRGREMVARPGARSEERHLELLRWPSIDTIEEPRRTRSS